MTTSQVSLQSEITREDGWKLVHWLKDNEVRQFLSDTQDVSSSLERVLERVNLPVLSHLFNQNGRFFIVRNRQGLAVGFVRLVVNAAETEIVLVIGERQQWGRSLGTHALAEALKIAFYEIRAPRVIARIRRSNMRSLRAFARAGFRPHHETADLFCLSLTLRSFLQQSPGRPTANRTILLTEIDRYRLQDWIRQHFHDPSSLNWAALGLKQEISKARIIESSHLPQDVLSMHAQATLTVNGQALSVALSYPHEANWPRKQLSVLSPVGTAILGYREGDRICWPSPTGFLDIEIKKLHYQPEAAGDYLL